MNLLTPLLPACRLLWAAPCSALGMLLAAIVLLAGGRMRWVQGAMECSLERDGVLANGLRRQPFAAITLGHMILALDASHLQRLHAHERVHVRQFERWGALLLLAYPAASMWAWLRGQDPYLENYFERAAHRADMEPDTQILFF